MGHVADTMTLAQIYQHNERVCRAMHGRRRLGIAAACGGVYPGMNVYTRLGGMRKFSNILALRLEKLHMEVHGLELPADPRRSLLWVKTVRDIKQLQLYKRNMAARKLQNAMRRLLQQNA